MKIYSPTRIAGVLFATVLVCMFAGTTHAQRDVGLAERTIGALENETLRPKDTSTILAEVNKDIERFRAINEELKTAAAGNGPLNFKLLSADALEIKKRGNRLKGNLAGLPKPEKEEKQPKEPVPNDDAQMRLLLTSVNNVMTSFLSNPVFSDTGTLDNQLAAKGRRDLDQLIAMSDVLKHGAEKLGKRTQ